jgi:Zn-finger domain-containing protein
MPRRRRVNLHQINEDVSDKFLTLKSNLELLDNLEELDRHFGSKQPIVSS